MQFLVRGLAFALRWAGSEVPGLWVGLEDLFQQSRLCFSLSLPFSFSHINKGLHLRPPSPRRDLLLSFSDSHSLHRTSPRKNLASRTFSRLVEFLRWPDFPPSDKKRLLKSLNHEVPTSDSGHDPGLHRSMRCISFHPRPSARRRGGRAALYLAILRQDPGTGHAGVLGAMSGGRAGEGEVGGDADATSAGTRMAEKFVGAEQDEFEGGEGRGRGTTEV